MMSSAFSLTVNFRRILLIAFWSLLVFRIVMLFQIPITDNSESRYAEMGRWMISSGNWITPEIAPGVPFWAKPPLSMWAAAAGIGLFGENEFGARIFIFLGCCVMLLLIYRWAAAIRGQDFALAATFILFTAAAFVVTSGTVMTDLLMTAGTTLCMVSFWNMWKANESSRLWRVLFFLGLAIGMLAKGPIAVVLTLLPIGLWAFTTGRLIETWKRIPWVRGGLFTLLVSAPWYIAAEIRTPGFLDYFIVGEHIKRFLVSGWTGDLYGKAHSETPGTIWFFGLAAMMPWSLILFAMAPIFVSRRAVIRANLKREGDPWFTYVLCWALAPMLFFTLSRNIISTYTLTGVPAFSLLIPELWRLASPVGRGLRIFLATGIAGSILLIAGIWICYLFFEDLAPEQSEKRMIQYVRAQDELANSDINYLSGARHSASFYSSGGVKFIDRDQLPALPKNERQDLLIVRNRDSDSLLPILSDYFSKIVTIGGRTLYSESKFTSDVSSPAN